LFPDGASVRFFAAKILSEVRANLSSPQSVRSIGHRFFENLKSHGSAHNGPRWPAPVVGFVFPAAPIGLVVRFVFSHWAEREKFTPPHPKNHEYLPLLAIIIKWLSS